MSDTHGIDSSSHAFPSATNVMDPNGMPSDQAQMARMKAQKVMKALQDGEPGEADEVMGKKEPKGTSGLVPLDWLKTKFGGKK